MNDSRGGRQELALDTADIRTSADRIDALADRLRTALAEVEKAGNPVPAGSDEVSVRAAGTLGRESDDLLAVLTAAVGDLSADAADLRAQADVYETAEDEVVGLFGGIRR